MSRSILPRHCAALQADGDMGGCACFLPTHPCLPTSLRHSGVGRQEGHLRAVHDTLATHSFPAKPAPPHLAQGITAALMPGLFSAVHCGTLCHAPSSFLGLPVLGSCLPPRSLSPPSHLFCVPHLYLVLYTLFPYTRWIRFSFLSWQTTLNIACNAHSAAWHYCRKTYLTHPLKPTSAPIHTPPHHTCTSLPLLCTCFHAPTYNSSLFSRRRFFGTAALYHDCLVLCSLLDGCCCCA